MLHLVICYYKADTKQRLRSRAVLVYGNLMYLERILFVQVNYYYYYYYYCCMAWFDMS